MRPLRMLLSSLAVGALASVGLAACGDDDDDGAAPADAAATDEEASPADAEDEPVLVTLADYEFRGLPSSVPAGTRFTVENVADEELHEMVVFRLPDDEERSVEELVNLPPDELGPLMGSLGQPATVLLATPGGPEIPAVGDGTLSEPGRYAVLCMIPVGIEPEVYLQAAEEAGGEAPQIEGAGPPHITAGMFAELVVE